MAEGDQGSNRLLIMFYFFFGVTMHLIDALVWQFDRGNFNYSGSALFVYIFMGFLYSLLRVNDDPLIKRLVINSVKSVFLWALPILLLWFAKFLPSTIQFQFATKLVAFLVLTPTWLWMASDFYAQIPPLEFLWTAYLFFWVGIIVLSGIFAFQNKLTQIADPMKAPVAQSLALIRDWIVQLWKNIKSTMIALPKAVSTAFNTQLNTAVGDEYYVGTVEDNENGPLGVYFTNTRMTNYEIFEGDEASAWVDITAKTLDEPITISVNCHAIDYDGNKFQGDMSQNSGGLTETIYVDSFSEEFLICKFGKTQLPPGSYQLIISASFNFETWAYLRTYLMDLERLKGDMKSLMDKGGIGDKNSVLSEIYNIPDTNPVARYTSGPVAIGIETNTQPVGIAGDGSTKPLFGVTIENLWEGKITKVNSLKMETIPGLQINTGSCDHSTNGGNNIYTISNIKGEIEFYKSFRCKMQASKSALDSTPVTIRNLKATAKYQYVIEDELYFDVEEYDFGEI